MPCGKVLRFAKKFHFQGNFSFILILAIPYDDCPCQRQQDVGDCIGARIPSAGMLLRAVSLMISIAGAQCVRPSLRRTTVRGSFAIHKPEQETDNHWHKTDN